MDLDSRIDIRIRLGEQIARARQESGLTREELAERAGITPGTVAKIETGRFSASVDLLDRVATALGCRIAIVGRR